MTDQSDVLGQFLPAGTRVRLDNQLNGKSEFGVVVHCWMDEEVRAYDCYIAFFGDSFPTGQPEQKPYVLRYFSKTLKVVPE
jgi:hypothetical protein